MFQSIRAAVAAFLVLVLALAAGGVQADEHSEPGSLQDARAYWLDERTIAWDAPAGSRVSLHSSDTAGLAIGRDGVDGGQSFALEANGRVAGTLAGRFPHLEGLPVWRLGDDAVDRTAELLKSQLAVSAAIDGAYKDATAPQIAGVLDALFAYDGALGVSFEAGAPQFRLWAPTARSVKLLLFDDADPSSGPSAIFEMEPEQGTWTLEGRADWNRRFYLYEVEVFVRSTGRIERNLVTDPYSLGLSMDSRRTQIVNLADEDLQPDGWDSLAKPDLDAPEDIVLYELHVRDFSVNDPGVPVAGRGTFAAFDRPGGLGMTHLRGLAEAGLSHVHLLPAFDCATIPENPADQQAPPDLSGFGADSERQQAEVGKVRARDAFNWCYDPYHYTVPEGSYSTDPDGVTRIREFRAMVAALNRAGLRVVMDVVYNHTTTSGQAPTSVLDRIVPDYYQRLDAQGRVETSTCCANTATEHKMMEKLMVDSLLTWARDYKVDGFRFDLMGHHSEVNLLRARDALQALAPERDGVDGASIYLYGEGWNFGEVADDARFVQATQKHMGDGTGIGTFNDRIRDAVRGGAHDDRGIAHVRNQGFVNGLYTDPNAEGSGSQAERARLLQLADLIRASLAGNLSDYRFVDRHGKEVSASAIDYHGQPAAYASDPQETIQYAAAHDNETLFDINQYKLPVDTPMADRVRAVNLANSIVMLAQGVPFFHAGQELLRSKSLDRNSFDSGDWFNPLDFSLQDNGWARGLPPAWDNADNWPVAAPLLADPALKPGPEHMRAAADHFRELLRIRRSSPLFRLRTADEVNERLRFHNTGPDQQPGLIVMSLAGDDETVVVLFNAAPRAAVFAFDGAGYALHPVQQASADPLLKQAAFDEAAGSFRVPARTAAVFVNRGID